LLLNVGLPSAPREDEDWRMPGPEGGTVSAPAEFDVAVTDCGAAVRVTVRGELDLETAPLLHGALREVESAGRTVTIDLRALTFMDSTGINLLTEHAARAEVERFELAILPPRPPVARVLDLAGVRRVLPLVDAGPPSPQGPGVSTVAPERRADLRVRVEDTPPVLRLRLVGELDLANVPRLRRAVDAYARTGQTMIVDLGDVDFIDSMGLAALVRARHRAHSRGAQFQLVAAPPRVHTVFILTGLHALFDWVPPSAPPT
jgi:anti-anti-sigma factor